MTQTLLTVAATWGTGWTPPGSGHGPYMHFIEGVPEPYQFDEPPAFWEPVTRDVPLEMRPDVLRAWRAIIDRRAAALRRLRASGD